MVDDKVSNVEGVICETMQFNEIMFKENDVELEIL